MNNFSYSEPLSSRRNGLVSGVVVFLIAIAVIAPGLVHAQEASDGQIRGADQIEVWNKALKEWVTPMKFWTTFAVMNGGLTWGVRQDYPEYDKVKERDLLIIELESGSCLMEFFHRRWRRANDVRRWDTRFNDVSGCPDVFD